MKITEILSETVEDIKLLLSIMGYDLQSLTTRSLSIQEQYASNPTETYAIGMKSYLFKINVILQEMANVPQWQTWINTSDGQLVLKEIEELYSNNVKFMKQHT